FHGRMCNLSSRTVFWGCVGFFFCLVLVLVCPAAAYNLDLEHSLVFKGPSSSMFGYSVLLHRHYSHKWLVVGAPVANSSSSQVQSPGAVYRCSITAERRTCYPMPAGQYVTSCGKTCEAESDHQWLGVSLSRQSSENGGLILVMPHLFHSCCPYCYYLLPFTSQHLFLSITDHQRKFGEYYGSCQAGISNVMTQDLIIMGAPGTSYWTGSVLAYNTSSGTLVNIALTITFPGASGYAVGAGHFLSPSSMEVVGGAPQFSQKGKRISGSSLGHDLRMFGQSLNSGIDIDDNGYKGKRT
uniref:Integrin alpha-2 domain-containing protein n=1 Tax=Cyprinodon variegatus TaxID=28743 RepID=A0A3Q2CR47_CYPVA